MRFMIIVKASKESEAGVMPNEKLLTEMGKYNEELVKAGIMFAGEGLRPSSKGARVRFSGTQRSVIDGLFAETKEQLTGFYMIEAKNLDGAIRIAAGIPPARVGSIELRPIRPVRETVARDAAAKHL